MYDDDPPTITTPEAFVDAISNVNEDERNAEVQRLGRELGEE